MSKMSLAFLLVVFSFAAEAQTNQENSPTAEEMHARKIAKRLKDSLSLEEGQIQQLFDANMKLHRLKLNSREQYANSDSLDHYILKLKRSGTLYIT